MSSFRPAFNRINKRRTTTSTAKNARAMKYSNSRLRNTPSTTAITMVPRSFGNPRAVTERKYFDTSVNNTAINANDTSWAATAVNPATILTLFAPTTGTDFNNRVGRKVLLKSIRITGHILQTTQSNVNAGEEPCVVRLVLVQDKQTNAAACTGADVIASGGANAPAVSMFQNPANFGRFRILKDKKHLIQNPALGYYYSGGTLQQNGLMTNFKYSVTFKKPLYVHFNATNAGTIADIIDNSFHLFALTVAAGPAPTISYKCRVCFTDQ